MAISFQRFVRLAVAMIFWAAIQPLAAKGESAIELWSANRTVRFNLGIDANGDLAYSVDSLQKPRVAPSRLGINVEGIDLGSKARLGAVKSRQVFETFAWRGNKSTATNSCAVAEIAIRSEAAKLDWTLEVRVFDDGVGFRYVVPGRGARRIGGETTGWELPADSVVWFQTDTTNYEGVYQSARADAIPLEIDVQKKGDPKKKEQTYLGPPVTIEFKDGTYGLISEAALYDYSGMTLQPLGEAKLRAVFQDDPQGWRHHGEIKSPWRVMVLSRDLNGLINSDVIPALCDPPDRELFPRGMDTEWIRPGKAPCTWMVYGNSGAKWHRQKWFVDMAAATGCEYLLVDAGWRTEQWGWLSEGGDAWARAAELCDYAAQRNVGIILWHAFPEGRDDGPGLATVESREDFFRQCQKAGVKGVKIDFFDSESKETIEAYEDLLRRSARYQLLINFHGANKPAGEPRTWPNEITREAIREQEYLLWDSLPLVHYGALPFTRLAVGHGDFLAGYVQRRFLKETTVIFQMASTVVMSSPFLCWPDNPEAYLHSPLHHFVRTVPVTWDETRVLPGSKIGSSVELARRKGDDWYIAVLNCSTKARTTEVDLSWLDASAKELVLYRDGASNEFCEINTMPIPESRKLKFEVLPGGGLIAHIRAQKAFTGWK